MHGVVGVIRLGNEDKMDDREQDGWNEQRQRLRKVTAGTTQRVAGEQGWIHHIQLQDSEPQQEHNPLPSPIF